MSGGGVQCPEVLPVSDEDVSMEEGGVAAPSEGGRDGGVQGQSNLEAQYALAEFLAERGSGISMGTLRSNETEVAFTGKRTGDGCIHNEV